MGLARPGNGPAERVRMNMRAGRLEALHSIASVLFALLLIGACSQAPEPMVEEEGPVTESETPSAGLQADPNLMQPGNEPALLSCQDMNGMRVYWRL